MAHHKVIVGLGNPGRKYIRTRHNAGFLVLDRVLALLEPHAGQPWRTEKKSGLYASWAGRIAAGSWILLKPETFMNASGNAVAAVRRYSFFEPSDLLVVHDELDLPFGRVRFKSGGGFAGHNGLKSIADQLGSADFHRLRVGIGRPVGMDTASYVLRPFSEEESTLLDQVIDTAARAVVVYCLEGEQAAMRDLHAKEDILLRP